MSHTIYFTRDPDSDLTQFWCITCSKHGAWRPTPSAARVDAECHQEEVLSK